MEVPQYKSRAGARLGVAAILLVVLVLLASAAMFSVVHRGNVSRGREESHYQRSELSDKVKIKRKKWKALQFISRMRNIVRQKMCAATPRSNKYCLNRKIFEICRCRHSLLPTRTAIQTTEQEGASPVSHCPVYHQQSYYKKETRVFAARKSSDPISYLLFLPFSSMCVCDWLLSAAYHACTSAVRNDVSKWTINFCQQERFTIPSSFSLL